MASLDAVANVAEIAGAVFVVGGLAFALLEVRRSHAMKRREAALELMHSFQTPTFTRGAEILHSLPVDCPAQRLRATSDDATHYAWQVVATFESLGILVFRREIPIDLAEEFFSGFVKLSWNRLHAFVMETRAAVGEETFGEWFQWLAERVEERASPEATVPAFRAHGDWR